MSVTKEISEYFSRLGKKGGSVSKERNLAKDPDYYKKIGEKGRQSRRDKKESASQTTP